MTAIRYDFNNGLIVAVGLAGTCIVVALVILVQAWFYKMESESYARNNAGVPLELSDYRAEEAAKLGGYAWKDRENNLVKIPLDKAKASVLKEYAR